MPLYCNAKHLRQLRNIAIERLSKYMHSDQANEHSHAVKYLKIVKCVSLDNVAPSRCAHCNHNLLKMNLNLNNCSM